MALITNIEKPKTYVDITGVEKKSRQLSPDQMWEAHNKSDVDVTLRYDARNYTIKAGSKALVPFGLIDVNLGNPFTGETTYNYEGMYLTKRSDEHTRLLNDNSEDDLKILAQIEVTDKFIGDSPITVAQDPKYIPKEYLAKDANPALVDADDRISLIERENRDLKKLLQAMQRKIELTDEDLDYPIHDDSSIPMDSGKKPVKKEAIK